MITFFFEKDTQSQWYWVEPKPTGNVLYSIHFANTLTGFAAGSLGNIFKSIDGGNTWEEKFSGTQKDLFEIFCVSKNICVAAGKSGLILRSSDSGENWQPNLNITNSDLHDIYFINNNTGFIVGLSGTILKTIDAGLNWYQVWFPKNLPLFSINFFNEKFGAAGGYKTLMITSDCGESWKIQDIHFNEPCQITGISVVDSNTIFAVSNSPHGTLYKTTNGGNNWTNSSLNIPHLFGGSVDLVRSMSFKDINTGFIVTDFGTILKTTNSGSNWIVDSSFRPSSVKLSIMYDVDIVDGNSVFISGGGGTVLKSTDDGLMWSVKTGNKKNIYSNFFINEMTGYCVGEDGNILSTFNGGMNWNRLKNFTNKNLRCIFFLRENTGYVCGDSGRIFKTINGGFNWMNQTNYTKLVQKSIYFVNSETGIVAGGNPENQRAFIYRTDNGGSNWYEVFDSINFGVLNSIAFLDEMTGLIAGDNGNIINTYNAGENWFISNLSHENLNSISFADDQNGLVSATNGLIYKTTNSGFDWKIINSGTYVDLQSIKYYDKDFAVAAGKNGTIIISKDGGDTWLPQQRITHNDFYSINLIDNEHIFAFGEYGSIINFQDNSSLYVNQQTEKKNLAGIHNYPNPFNSSTRVSYELQSSAHVKLTLYNTSGRQIEILLNENAEPGKHEIDFNAGNLPSGIYYLTMKANEIITTKKILLLK